VAGIEQMRFHNVKVVLLDAWLDVDAAAAVVVNLVPDVNLDLAAAIDDDDDLDDAVIRYIIIILLLLPL
jgi:hypothetical protein